MKPAEHVVAAIFLMGAVGFFLGAVGKHGAFSEAAAAWAQAIGTVIAVFTAIWVARAEVRAQERRRAEDTHGQLVVLVTVARQLAAAVAQTMMKTGVNMGFDPANFDHILRALDEVELKVLPSAMLMQIVVDLRRQGYFYRNALAVFFDLDQGSRTSAAAHQELERLGPFIRKSVGQIESLALRWSAEADRVFGDKNAA